MNCIDVRRQLLSEPSNVDEAIQEHLRHCSACARFSNDLVVFEHSLKQAAQVPVPEGLASRILLQQRLEGQRHQRRWQGLAVAASLLFSVGLVMYLGLPVSEPTLQVSVLNHVEQELHHLQDRKDVQLADLNRVLRPQGLRVATLNRQIHYAGTCQMRRQLGAHLVIASPTGPVTVLMMPGEFIQTRQAIKDERFQGIILPTAQGSMAIIGEDAEQLDQIARELQAGLHAIS